MRVPSSSMDQHFSGVAASYNELRTTDLEPILFIKDILGGQKSVRAIDVACGGGRYSLLLCQHLPGLRLTLNDLNRSMLSRAAGHLAENGIKHFTTMKADVAHLRLRDGAMDAVFTFNAIHHFDPSLFVNKAARALAVGGHLFIYTRLPSQNAGSIWGRYFPLFAEKEDRLYRLSDFKSWRDNSGSLSPARVTRFRFQRRATLAQLLHQVRSKHYSTFSLFSAAELNRAVIEFERTIRKRFPDLDWIEWSDENVMIVYRKDVAHDGGLGHGSRPTGGEGNRRQGVNGGDRRGGVTNADARETSGLPFTSESA